jgi:hypothetical protein
MRATLSRPYGESRSGRPKSRLHFVTNDLKIATSPQLPDASLSVAEKNAFDFSVLSDAGNRVARSFGLVYALAEELRAALRSNNKALPSINGDESWELCPCQRPLSSHRMAAWRSLMSISTIAVALRLRTSSRRCACWRRRLLLAAAEFGADRLSLLTGCSAGYAETALVIVDVSGPFFVTMIAADLSEPLSWKPAKLWQRLDSLSMEGKAIWRSTKPAISWQFATNSISRAQQKNATFLNPR